MNKFFIKPGKSNFKPLLAQKHQKEIFPQKIIEENFSCLCYCNFMQYIKKIPALIFGKT